MVMMPLRHARAWPIPPISVLPNDAKIKYTDRIGTLVTNGTTGTNTRPLTDPSYAFEKTNPGMRISVGVSGSGWVYFHLEYTGLILVSTVYWPGGAVLVDDIERGTFTTVAAYNQTATVVAQAPISEGNTVASVMLPVSASVRLKGISTYGAITLSAAPARPARRIVGLGDSRMQALPNNDPNLIWFTKACRTLNAEGLNLGEGGARVRSDLVSLYSAYAPTAVVHLADINDSIAGTSAASVQATATTLLNAHKAALPTVPFFWLTSLASTSPSLITSLESLRQAGRDAVAAAGGAGSKLYIIEGAALAGPFTDLIHPTTEAQATAIAAGVSTAVAAII